MGGVAMPLPNELSFSKLQQFIGENDMKASIFYFRPFVYAKYGEKSLMVFSPYLCVACLYTQTFTVQWKNHGEFLPMVFLPQCTVSSVAVH